MAIESISGVRSVFFRLSSGMSSAHRIGRLVIAFIVCLAALRCTGCGESERGKGSEPTGTPARPATAARGSKATSNTGKPPENRWWEMMDGASARPADSSRPSDPAAALRHELDTALRAIRNARLGLAEQSLRRALEIAPHDVRAHRGLVVVLNTLGRRWESWPHVLALIREGQFAVEDLLFLANYDEWYENQPLLRRAIAVEPENPSIWLGIARIDHHDNRTEEARRWLERAVKKAPELLEAQAQLGRLLLEERDEAAFLRWQAALPASADRHPEIWVNKGYWAQRHGQAEAAARCFWEAARVEPAHQRAHYQLALMLTRLQDTELAEKFMQRARRLADLGAECHPIFLIGPDIPRMRRIIDLQVELGQLWEAWAWSVAAIDVAHRKGTPVDELESRRDALRAQLDRERPPRVVAASRIAEQVDLRARFPLPVWPSMAETARAESPPTAPALRFDDRAAAAGIDFVYFDSAKERPDGLQFMDSTGGGVAVLDYDGDGWPDLYFSQGGRWPGKTPIPTHEDKLYRNLGNGKFADVTAAAGLGDKRFSQGCASGDFNNDGFPDLFLSNIGQNRLYLNNGDGTFTEVPWPKDPRPLMWSTSCAIVDLNRDGLPDIFDVYYVTGDDVYTRRCGRPEKRESCGPIDFDPVANRMFLNRGDGSWYEATRASGLERLLGKGLGILIADFERDGDLEVFVSNDAVANFYLKWNHDPQSADRAARPPKVDSEAGCGVVPVWRDEGLLRGVALNRDGRAEACMGIAAADLNDDGLVDLYVTNYYEESNTLYLQQPGPLFIDVTHEANLHDATFQLLGWGTQFLDADLDGDPDLIVTNGHAEDHRDRGVALRMPPQLFVNVGNGEYQEVERNVAGSYFADEYLGRGMALIDWNRDGLEDAVVSNIGARASLVTNVTPGAGHYVAVRLRGRKAARDAYGTIVTIHYGNGKSRTRQLCAGNGYQACNERQLLFGLGDADRVERIEIVWPSGTNQTFGPLAAGTTWIVVEGRNQLWALPADN